MRSRTTAILCAIAGIATACTTGARIGSAAGGSGTPRVIAYEAGPCFGACPVYALTLDTATGAGTFDGRRFVAVTGKRAFAVTPAQSLAFSAAMDEVRRLPADAFQQGGVRCATAVTDQASVTLTWSGGGAAPVTRRVYFGCGRGENRALFTRLRDAPRALPIADFIARR